MTTGLTLRALLRKPRSGADTDQTATARCLGEFLAGTARLTDTDHDGSSMARPRSKTGPGSRARRCNAWSRWRRSKRLARRRRGLTRSRNAGMRPRSRASAARRTRCGCGSRGRRRRPRGSSATTLAAAHQQEERVGGILADYELPRELAAPHHVRDLLDLEGVEPVGAERIQNALEPVTAAAGCDPPLICDAALARCPMPALRRRIAINRPEQGLDLVELSRLALSGSRRASRICVPSLPPRRACCPSLRPPPSPLAISPIWRYRRPRHGAEQVAAREDSAKRDAQRVARSRS
jgi:hypothetical protein